MKLVTCLLPVLSNVSTISLLKEKTKRQWCIALSATYDFEVAKAFFGYQYASRFHSFDQLEDVTVAGKGMNQNAFTLGAEVPAAGGTFKVAANYGFGKVKSADGVVVGDEKLSNDKFNRLTVGAAYEYPLSKRTFVYGWGAYATAGKMLKEKPLKKTSSLGV